MIFVKLSGSLVINFIKSVNQTAKNWIEKGILVNFLEILFISGFFTSTARFSKFDAENVILFQIKVFDRNIKETTLERYFIKVTTRPRFMSLRAIKRTNRVH